MSLDIVESHIEMDILNSPISDAPKVRPLTSNNLYIGSTLIHKQAKEAPILYITGIFPIQSFLNSDGSNLFIDNQVAEST